MKSTFVTVLGWLTVAIAGFGFFMGLMQLLAVTLVVGFEHEQASTIFLVIGLGLLIAGIALASGIGLIRRKAWSRIAMLCLLALGIIWQLVSIVAMPFVVPGTEMFSDDPEIETFQVVIRIGTAIVSVATAAFFSFCIYKLTRTEIRSEFIDGGLSGEG